MLDSQVIRHDFPILDRQVHGKPLVYLDSAATSQKPRVVIEAITKYYQEHNANVHRGVHQLGDESTQLFHSSRQTIADFFGAQPEELIIVRNTTEAANQIAYTWGEAEIGEGDVIVVSGLEHHSNLVPWQQLVKRKKAELKIIPISAEGTLILNEADFKNVADRIKLVCVSHVSNTLGTLVDLEHVTSFFKKLNPHSYFFVDGAQAAPHIPINFAKLPVHFYAVSAHKMLGPMGIGGLFVKKNLLQNLPPFLFGGGMINEVSFAETSFADDLEERFTAGTPDVAGQVGWAAACEYLSNLTMSAVAKHDQELVRYAIEKLTPFQQLKIIGLTDKDQLHNRVGSVAFVYEGVHAHDVGQVLDSEGIAVRSGHHCTMPLHTQFGWGATTRISFNVYNQKKDIDQLVTALEKVKTVFGR